MPRFRRQPRGICIGLVTTLVGLSCMVTAVYHATVVAADSCGGANSGYYYTSFITCSGGTTYSSYVGMEALVSDASVTLNSGGVHVLEYVDSVTTGTCQGTTCWAQSGWGFGQVGTANSGSNQRPYFERNDAYGYLPYFDTNVGVHCCGAGNLSNTSTFWDGLVDGNNNGEFESFFNNEVNSGNVFLGYAELPGHAREDMTGEEYTTNQRPTVGTVNFTAAELDPSSPGSFYAWTSANGFPGDEFRSSSYYPFSSTSDFTGFQYYGP